VGAKNNRCTLTVLERLNTWFDAAERVSVAASGGVDSTTLAIMAHRRLGTGCKVFHSVSPAVPPVASERLAEIAKREGWLYEVVNTGEFDDPEYLANPVNRCFFCKKNLYGTLAPLADGVLLSGTNLDDLSDYRPGLQAADRYAVRHPYVEVGVDKTGVRALASALGFEDLSELPAAPCLSSRVETGIPVEPKALRLIDAVERHIAEMMDTDIVRFRVRRETLIVELDEPSLERMEKERRAVLGAEIKDMAYAAGFDLPISFAVYRRGSAFIQRDGK